MRLMSVMRRIRYGHLRPMTTELRPYCNTDSNNGHYIFDPLHLTKFSPNPYQIVQV